MNKGKNGLILKQFFHRLGFIVDWFTNSLLAFVHLKNNSNSYYLIITDLRMQDITGIDLDKKQEEKNLTGKILPITAFDIHDLKNKDFKQQKIERLVQNPIKLSSLKEIISQSIF